MKIKQNYCKAMCFLMFAFMLGSCAASSVVLTCQEPTVEMYINEEYAGRDMVRYSAKRGNDIMRVTCKENGVEVYTRTYNIRGYKNRLIELTIPKDYRYSPGKYSNN